MIHRITAVLCFLFLFPSSASAYGPYDYTNPLHYAENLPVVESYHFNSDVENLLGDMTGSIWGDLDYCLRAFPNHHRALNSMGRLWRQSRAKNRRPPNADPIKTAEFYFEHAMRFVPLDGTVRLLYGIHLHASGKRKEALEQYLAAEKLAPDSSELLYNMGLLYMDLKDINQAKAYAIKSYEKNYPLKGLKQRLKKAGAWDQENVN